MDEFTDEPTLDISALGKVKHNEPDFAAFRSFQRQIDSTYEVVERRRIKQECIANLKAWLKTLPPRWKQARLTRIADPAAALADEIIKNSKTPGGSFYIQGKEGSGKTYLSYAILRRYIGKGWSVPSRIKIIAEETMLSTCSAGYIGAAKFEELLNSNYDTFVVDNVGIRDSYRSEKELLVWERLIEHVYSHNYSLIITSSHHIEAFLKLLSSSGAEKLGSMLEGRVLHMKEKEEKRREVPQHEMGTLFSKHFD